MYSLLEAVCLHTVLTYVFLFIKFSFCPGDCFFANIKTPPTYVRDMTLDNLTVRFW